MPLNANFDFLKNSILYKNDQNYKIFNYVNRFSSSPCHNC